MRRQSEIDTVKKEILYLIQERLSPVAISLRYSSVPLEVKMKWQPTVLLLGNYSSGKSTFINELIGGAIQETGQAPTDDRFTVLTAAAGEASAAAVAVEVVDEREGQVVLHDPEFPFQDLRRHGERLASHFRLKKISGSQLLREVALIDTPGMIDAVTEKDRAYDYQEIIRDLAQISDLILVFFDPHKAGTIKESYTSLKETLPQATYQDRIVFVMNRIDECVSLGDLLRVYGALCWNLSQMTGRKDIPKIFLCYSETLSPQRVTGESRPFLHHLANQREDLVQLILATRRHRLDHLVGYLELHAERLEYLLEELIRVRRRRNSLILRLSLVGVVVSLLAGAGVGVSGPLWQLVGSDASEDVAIFIGFGMSVLSYAVWHGVAYRMILPWARRGELRRYARGAGVARQSLRQREVAEASRELLLELLRDGFPFSNLRELRARAQLCRDLLQTAAPKLREAIRHIR